jgi:hypothetical protein
VRPANAKRSNRASFDVRRESAEIGVHARRIDFPDAIENRVRSQISAGWSVQAKGGRLRPLNRGQRPVCDLEIGKGDLEIGVVGTDGRRPNKDARGSENVSSTSLDEQI